MSNTVETVCYLQVKPEFRNWGNAEDREKVRNIKVARVTAKPPRDPLPGCVVTKLRLRFPVEAFEPLKPEAVIDIPLSHTEAVLVETEPVVLPAPS